MNDRNMRYFDSHPQQFRFLLVALGSAFVGLGAFTLVRVAVSPTDENLFRNTPSEYYFARSFPATYEKVVSKAPASIIAAASVDSILAGDFGTAVSTLDGRAAVTPHEADSMLASGEVVRATVLRGSLNASIQYLIATRDIPPGAIRKLKNAVIVVAVAENGASDRAGMKVGDAIMRINGQEFRDMVQADSLLREGQTGKALRYDILRANQPLALDVVLAQFGIPIVTLVAVLCGMFCFGTGMFIALKRPQYRGARLFGVAFVLVGFGTAFLPVPQGFAVEWYLRMRGLAGILSLVFGTGVLLHLYTYFPVEWPALTQRPWIHRTGYLLTAAVAVAVAFVQKPIVPAALALVLALYAAFVKVLFRKQRPPDHKRLTLAIKSFLLASLLLLVAAAILRDRMLISDAGLIVIAGIGFILFPLAHLYTIGRYRLYDLKLRIRTNVQYSFVTGAWTLLLIALAGKLFLVLPHLTLDLPNIVFRPASIEVTSTPLNPSERSILEKTVLMALAIGLVFVTWRIGKIGQRLIDKRYYRSQYDYRRAAAELAEVMATRLGMVELARGIIEKLVQHMKLKRAGVLLFREQRTCCCYEAHGFEDNTWKQFCIKAGPHIISTLQSSLGELNVDRLPPELNTGFRDIGIRYLVPIHSKEKLVGALLVGEKLSESSFTHDDLSFLSSAASQSSVAIENAFLYEELAEKERMKHELTIARRIQLASLPQKTPRVHGLDIAGVSVPALEVGGDFYDYLNGVAGELTVVVGDVSGKGTSAALYMSKVQGILRSLHGFGLSPRELFIRANHLLCNDLERNSFVTAMGASFSPGRRNVALARAGHLPLYYYSAATKGVQRITPKGLGLGLSAEALFADELEERVIHYQAGDIFVFVTDGLTEERGTSGEEYGEDRLQRLLESDTTASAIAVRDRLMQEVTEFAGQGTQHDDQTVVVVRAT